MNCKQVKELLITDYADKQLSLDEKAVVDQHLSECVACTEYSAMIQSAVIEPINKIEHVNLPESLWKNIKTAIEEDSYVESTERVLRLPEILRNVFTSLQLRYAVCVVAFVLVLFLSLSGKSIFHNQPVEEISIQQQTEQIEYIAYLVADNGDLGEDNDELYGQAIEEYFL